jgi:hypothetical protein
MVFDEQEFHDDSVSDTAPEQQGWPLACNSLEFVRILTKAI